MGPPSQTPASNFLGNPQQSRQELKERVERYLREEERNAEKNAYFRASSATKKGEGSGYHTTKGNQSYLQGRDSRPRRYQAYNRGNNRAHINVIGGRNPPPPREKPGRAKYREYHQSRTHSTQECLMLRREVEEKQLKGNIIEIARTLRGNLGIPQRALVPPKEEPKNVSTIRSKSRTYSRHPTATAGALDLSFSMTDPRPPHWRGGDPLVIAGYIHNWRIWRIYVDTGSTTYIIYEHRFR